jgi:hypothetical protein
VALTPEQRVLRSRAAAFVQWSREGDRTARTATARAAFLDRFERQVDPAGELDPAERARRAAYARRAYFNALALKSSRARAARKPGGDGSTS